MMNGELKGKMDNKSNGSLFATLAFALAILLAVTFAGMTSGRTASPKPAAPAASGPDTRAAVAMPALAVQSSGKTNGLVRVYQSPQTGSAVTNVLPPSQTVQILGRSQDGTYLAIAGQSGAGQAAGWVASNEISTAHVSATTRSLVKVYGSPDDSSRIANVLAPSSTVSVLGRSPDGRWYAIAQDNLNPSMSGWVLRAEMATDDVEAQATSLVKVYRSPDDRSMVVGVFTPAQTIVLSGRNAQGSWYAVTGKANQGATGWISSAAIETSPAATDLPVMPVKGPAR